MLATNYPLGVSYFTRNPIFILRTFGPLRIFTHCSRHTSIIVFLFRHARIVDERRIIPFILPGRMNGHQQLEFLRKELPVLLEAVPLAMAAEHGYAFFTIGYRRIFFDYLNKVHQIHWIERGESIARSPNRNPLDFF